jgi:cytochrome c553
MSSCLGCHAPGQRGKHPDASGRRTPASGNHRSHASPSWRRTSSTVMGRIAEGFCDDGIRAIAVWLVEQH